LRQTRVYVKAMIRGAWIMPDKEKIVEDENDREMWSSLAHVLNTAANAAYLMTRALGYPRCKERDEAVAFAARQLDERVQETKDLFNKLFKQVPTEPEEVVSLEEDESDRKIKVVGGFGLLRRRAIAGIIRNWSCGLGR
jgi:hypothetical protein